MKLDDSILDFRTPATVRQFLEVSLNVINVRKGQRKGREKLSYEKITTR